MKAIIVIFFITTVASAGYPAKVRYWYFNNVSTNVPALSDIVRLEDHGDGQGIRFKWKIQNPPSKVTIDAINDNVAKAWWDDKQLADDVDCEKWSDRERRMFKLLIKEINKLRVKNNDPAYTVNQIKQALKAE